MAIMEQISSLVSRLISEVSSPIHPNGILMNNTLSQQYSSSYWSEDLRVAIWLAIFWPIFKKVST